MLIYCKKSKKCLTSIQPQYYAERVHICVSHLDENLDLIQTQKLAEKCPLLNCDVA